MIFLKTKTRERLMTSMAWKALKREEVVEVAEWISLKLCLVVVKVGLTNKNKEKLKECSKKSLLH